MTAVKVVLGLPHLSNGPLLAKARAMDADILVSASALARYRDDGPMPPGFEFTPMERMARAAKGDVSPPTKAQSARRAKEWSGWNRAPLDNADGMRLWIDSAGFVAQSLKNGYEWTPESYVLDLCDHPAVMRFSSMDLCVEPEVAGDRAEVSERIAKTVHLNKRCSMLARDVGILDRFMPVIQGWTADDYLRCFDRLSGAIGDDRLIGVGSMCRRRTSGSEGIVSIIDRLDRELPKGVRLHLFGLKSDGAEAVAMLSDRVYSIDSQAYGVRARRIANDRRAQDPGFSKSNVFVAGVMEDWYRKQVSRMERGSTAIFQPGFGMAVEDGVRARTVMDALEAKAREQINDLISDGDLDHDQLVTDAMLLAWMQDWLQELPEGTQPGDIHVCESQLPVDLRMDRENLAQARKAA